MVMGFGISISRLSGFLGWGVLATTLLACGQVAFQEAGPDAEDRTKPLLAEEENFIQDRDSTAIDVLFVVDNSGSMADEHALVAARFSAFSQALTGLNWQIGLTTTDTQSSLPGARGALLPLAGRTDRVLTPQVPSFDQVFGRTIRRPESIDCSLTGRNCPSGLERPLMATALAIALSQPGQVNQGFFRERTDVALVIMTDEDEDITGNPADHAVASEVMAAFSSRFGRSKSLVAHSISIVPGDASCLASQAGQGGVEASYSTLVQELVESTGGYAASICDSDYSVVLRDIGRRIQEQVSSFQLKFKPSRFTTSVRIEPEQGITWRLDGSRLVLSKVPAKGTRIKVRYQRRGD